MIARIKSWVAAIGVVLVALAGVFLRGRQVGKKHEQDIQAQRRADNAAAARAQRHQVEIMDDTRIVDAFDELRDKRRR